MANKLSWVLEMVDKVSGPTKAAKGSLGDFIQTTHSALAAVQLIGQAAVGAGRLIASGLQPAISREKSLGAFEQLLGSAEKARDMYSQAVKFAAATPYETAQVVQSYKQLLTAQFSEEEVPIALQIIGDAASMSEAPQEALNTIIQQMGQMKSIGRASMEDLQPIFQAAMISQADYIKNVADNYGVTIDKARELQSGGKVSADVASFAVLKTMMDKTGGNMERASKQVGGLVSTLQSRPAEFLAKLQDTQGYDSLRDVLGRMAGAFDPETSGLTPFITQLGSGVLERASVTLDYLSAGAMAFMDGLSAGLGPMGEAFGPTNQTNLDKFKVLMEGVGTGIASAVKGVGFFVDKLSDVWGYLTKIGVWLSENKTFSGFLDEYIAPLTTAEQTTGSGASSTQALLVAQQRQRDRRVALEQQAGMPEAPAFVAIPAFASGAIVRRPTLALVGDRGPEMIKPVSGNYERLPSGSSGGTMPTINASFVFNGVAGTQEAAQDIRREVEAGLYSMLERFALQSGRYA